MGTTFRQFSFSLNTTISNATKCTPFEIVYGRNPVLPVDIYFGISDRFCDTDILSTDDYSSNVRTHLKDLYENVRDNLQVSRDKMKRQYDKNVNFQNYEIGEKVWLKKKNFKVGESRKLSPRKTGPWTIRNKMTNGVTYQIENDSTKKTLVVHHDRMERVKRNKSNSAIRDDQNESDQYDSDISSSETEREESVDEMKPNVEPRYPTRVRTQRMIEGAIPWDAVQLDLITQE